MVVTTKLVVTDITVHVRYNTNLEMQVPLATANKGGGIERDVAIIQSTNIYRKNTMC